MDNIFIRRHLPRDVHKPAFGSLRIRFDIKSSADQRHDILDFMDEFETQHHMTESVEVTKTTRKAIERCTVPVGYAQAFQGKFQVFMTNLGFD